MPEPVPELLEPSNEIPPAEDTICDDQEIMYKERSFETGKLRFAFLRSLVIASTEDYLCNIGSCDLLDMVRFAVFGQTRHNTP